MRLPAPRTDFSRVLAALAASALIAGGLGACGSDDDASGSGARPAPDASAFPSADGRSIERFERDYPADDELVIAPSVQVFTEGRNRFGFGVFRVDHTQVDDAEVALYAAPASGGPLQGPFPARVESLETVPAFTAENTANDPDAAKSVYVADVDFDDTGEWRVVALAREGEKFELATVAGPVVVQRDDPVPAVGEKAPRVHTPTADEVANIQEIDTRVPPGTMHDHDLADVLGKRPVVLLFATPALCQSRVCGPVVDVTEQVKRDHPDAAAYIHMEIYEDNEPGPNNLRPQVEAYNLPTEPWLFVIDEDGRVSTRIEGAFSAAELEQALRRLGA